MAQTLITFIDLVDSVREKLGIQSSDTLATNKIKRILNEVYQDEIVPFKQWMWLQKTTQIIHNAAYATGTAEATQFETVITLDAAPDVGLGSFNGYRFSLKDSSQVYTIVDHVAGDASFDLNIEFQEPDNAEGTYQIWRDRVDLPINAKETVDIWHSQWPKPLEGIGSQAFRALEAAQPKAEGFPRLYNTYDFHDPSSDGDDETESDRYRQTRVYPAINTENVVLNVDFIQEVSPLEDDTDEPLMPVGDRAVLFYGAMSAAAASILRNEEMSATYEGRFQRKLARMAGDREEGQDTPKLSPNARYINSIRRSGLRRRSRRSW